MTPIANSGFCGAVLLGRLYDRGQCVTIASPKKFFTARPAPGTKGAGVELGVALLVMIIARPRIARIVPDGHCPSPPEHRSLGLNVCRARTRATWESSRSSILGTLREFVRFLA